MNERTIAVIDLKAFYAMVECVERQLDGFTTPLIVADKSRGSGTIVLSVSPYLKSQGVPSRCRVFELPKRDDIIFATPRMSLYLQRSAEVMSIFLDFVGEDDLHVYSIDEAFLNLGPYLKMYNCTPIELVQKIFKQIHTKLGLFATAGIGPNNFLAKTALDHEAKKAKNGIAQWTMEDIPTKLWTLKPLDEMWGIAPRLQIRLNNLGLFSVYDLAHYPRHKLSSYLGAMGEQLWDHANGIDEANIREKYIPSSPSLSMGQVFYRDYKPEEVSTVIREMCDDLCLRLRMQNLLTGVVHLFVGYSASLGGFGHQMSLLRPTDDNEILTDALLSLFFKFVEQKPIRNVGFGFGKLTSLEVEQLDLFIDPTTQDRKRRLQRTIDDIRLKYGSNAVLRTSSLLKESTTIQRHTLIGGHRR